MGLLEEYLFPAIDSAKRTVGRGLLGTFTDPGGWLSQSVARYIEENLPSRTEARDAQSVMPGMADPYMNKMAGLGMQFGPAQTVYHGSPHVFDKFDMSRIGSGEGAQAYGHGLYVAENPSVAKDYQPKGWKRSYQFQGKQGVDWQQQFQDAGDYGRAQVWESIQLHVPKDRLVQNMKDEGYPNDVVKYAASLPKRLFAQPSGNLYKVDLPDEHIAKMLDWDAPLSKQNNEMRSALLPIVQRSIDEGFTTLKDAEKATGKDAYYALTDMATGWNAGGGMKHQQTQEAASQYLQSLGIPGIRYLDQGSRAEGKGTSNYVVFDDKLLNILGRE